MLLPALLVRNTSWRCNWWLCLPSLLSPGQVAGIIVQPLEAVFQDASCFGSFDYGEQL